MFCGGGFQLRDSIPGMAAHRGGGGLGFRVEGSADWKSVLGLGSWAMGCQVSAACGFGARVESCGV